jgi:hypothetical protein
MDATVTYVDLWQKQMQYAKPLLDDRLYTLVSNSNKPFFAKY